MNIFLLLYNFLFFLERVIDFYSFTLLYVFIINSAMKILIELFKSLSVWMYQIWLSVLLIFFNTSSWSPVSFCPNLEMLLSRSSAQLLFQDFPSLLSWNFLYYSHIGYLVLCLPPHLVKPALQCLPAKECMEIKI